MGRTCARAYTIVLQVLEIVLGSLDRSVCSAFARSIILKKHDAAQSGGAAAYADLFKARAKRGRKARASSSASRPTCKSPFIDADSADAPLQKCRTVGRICVQLSDTTRIGRMWCYVARCSYTFRRKSSDRWIDRWNEEAEIFLSEPFAPLDLERF